MKLHLIDGTYELFRAHFGAPPAQAPDGRQVGATRGLLRSMLAFVQQPDVTHVAIAFDHVIESFRNGLYPGYKTSEGVPPELLAQFELAEDVSRALGIVTWPMVEMEADDALATGAFRYAADVDQVLICTPDKDLAQCVRGEKIVGWDRKRGLTTEAVVRERFGVAPASIPDWLALVGDDADGIPGLTGWGPRSAGTVLARYGHLEDIPDDARKWDVTVRGADTLAQRLKDRRRDVELYRVLATLRPDAPITEKLDELRWRGADRAALTSLAASIGDGDVVSRVNTWR